MGRRRRALTRGTTRFSEVNFATFRTWTSCQQLTIAMYSTVVRQYVVSLPLRITCRRTFTTSSTKARINLAFDYYGSPKSPDLKQHETESPIIFIHGLFGSKKNNRSMSKHVGRSTVYHQSLTSLRVLARDLDRPVYAIVCSDHWLRWLLEC